MSVAPILQLLLNYIDKAQVENKFIVICKASHEITKKKQYVAKYKIL